MAKTQKKLAWAMCVFLVLSSLLLQNVSANTRNSIPLFGKWKEGARSVSSSIPITAYINDGVLSIHSSTQRSDIKICISKDGKVLYEDTVPGLSTGSIETDLSNFDLGAYSVELKNQWGDCLCGEFIHE